jgi:hypothetical protein
VLFWQAHEYLQIWIKGRSSTLFTHEHSLPSNTGEPALSHASAAGKLLLNCAKTAEKAAFAVA